MSSAVDIPNKCLVQDYTLPNTQSDTLSIPFSFGKQTTVGGQLYGRGDNMKPKYKVTKSQLRKRRNKRFTTKPARMRVKLWLANMVKEWNNVRINTGHIGL